MTDQEIDQLVIGACMKHGIRYSDSLVKGEVWFELQGAEAVLGELPPEIRVAGFETFRIVNGDIYPQLEYLAAFRERGAPVPEALVAITDWPRAPQYWIYPMLYDSNEPWL